MQCTRCRMIGCACLFTEESKAAKVPVCKKCDGSAAMEELAEINAAQKDTMDTFQTANAHSLLGNVKMQRLRDLARSVAHVEGSFAELGVYKGGSAFLLASDHSERMLHLFDTFKGIPFTGANDKHQIGDFNDTSIDAVQKLLDGKKVLFHQGLFPETTKGLEFEKYAFVHVDGDQYQTTIDACEYFYPRMAEGGIMLFDDYEWRDCPGVKKALNEFAAKNKVSIIHHGNFQASFRKTARPQVTLFSACKGIGDHICSMYACAGIAAAGYEVIYYGKHPMWYERVQEPHVTVINAEQVSIPDGAIDVGARYDEQLKKATCRKQWYCDNFCIAMGLEVGSIKPQRPKRDLSVNKKRDDAGQYVVMHVSSAWAVRSWTKERVCELVALLAARGIKVIGIDGPNQEKRVREIYGGSNATFVWGYHANDVADLFMQAKAVIAIDSGMAHFAALLDVPTVAICGLVSGSMVFGETDVKYVDAEVLECNNRAMKSITAARVFDAAMGVLQ